VRAANPVVETEVDREDPNMAKGDKEEDKEAGDVGGG
jgi:hypothetical protein